MLLDGPKMSLDSDQAEPPELQSPKVALHIGHQLVFNCVKRRSKKGSKALSAMIHVTVLVRELTGVPVHPPPPPPPPPMILREWYHFVQGTLRNHISDVTRKKNWDSEIISCRIMILGSKPIFSWSRNQINTLYSMADHYYVCKRMKNLKKSKMAANFALYFGKFVITSVLVAIRRWFWCLNLSFHVWGFQ